MGRPKIKLRIVKKLAEKKRWKVRCEDPPFKVDTPVGTMTFASLESLADAVGYVK